MDKQSWYDLGPADIFSQSTEVLAGNTRLAVTWQGGKFGVISGVCNHAGGPLGRGHLVDRGHGTQRPSRAAQRGTAERLAQGAPA